ncbi:hypothetical protein [Phyllobacterium calauticae]|uniref:hypothetical protein n=1 Tax=Phyllobacterium calauticae TaxID=2817027 RepID=UPI001CBA7F2A|nr:hypothetical protein [Phyllobacterium calauticae]MBZ3690991.1 hypothetical protein [Phyllobacterium calauticae]
MADDSEFFADLQSREPLVVVIKTLIYIEHELLEFIDQSVINPESIRAMRLEYSGLVHLAIALGLPSEFKSSLMTTAQIRNKFAHNLHASLDENLVDNLYKSLGPTAKQAAQTSYDLVIQKYPDAGHVKKLADLPPLNRFVLLAIVVKNGVKHANDHLRKHYSRK